MARPGRGINRPGGVAARCTAMPGKNGRERARDHPPALEAGIWIDDRERCWCLVVSSPPFFLLIFWREKKKRNFAAVKLFRFILKVFDPVGHNIAAREMRSSRNYMESLFSERKNQSCIYARG